MMKKLTLGLALIASIALIISCGGGMTEEEAQKQAEEMVSGLEEAMTEAVETPVAEEAAVAEPTMDLTAGKAIYDTKCMVCHQANGEGLPGAFPPLAKSDFLADKTASIKATIEGLTGEITVNGVVYNSAMAAVPMSDEELLDVMNYVYNSWGNEGVITAEDIAAAK